MLNAVEHPLGGSTQAVWMMMPVVSSDGKGISPEGHWGTRGDGGVCFSVTSPYLCFWKYKILPMAYRKMPVQPFKVRDSYSEGHRNESI